MSSTGSCDGSSLHSLLSSLGCPTISTFTPSSLDWITESSSRQPFLNWMISSLTSDLILQVEELDQFSIIPSDNLLSGPLLSSALTTCGLSSETEGLTEAQLEDQVRELEFELTVQEECRDKLEHIKDKIGDQLVREQAECGQLDHLLEREDREERRRQQQMMVLNTDWNKAVTRLTSAVEKCVSLHTDGRKFLVKLQLERLQEVEDRLDQELQVMIAREFSGQELRSEEELAEVVNINSPVCLELVQGRSRQEFNTLVSEVNRLRVSFYKSETERLLLLGEEAGLRTALSVACQEKETHLIRPVISEPGDVVLRLEQELEGLVGRLAIGHCQNILTEDYRGKVARGRNFILRLERVRDILVEQVSRGEVLRVLMSAEKRRVEEVRDDILNVLETYRKELKKVENFKTAMKSLKSSGKTDPTLITGSDPVMMRAQKVMSVLGLVPSHLATYPGLKEAVERLQKMRDQLITDKEVSRSKRMDMMRLLDKRVKQMLNQLNIKTNSRVQLAPKAVTDNISSFDNGLRDVEKEVKKLMEVWEKDKQEVKNKPHVRLQRDIWVDFLVNPQILTANIKSLMNKVRD